MDTDSHEDITERKEYLPTFQPSARIFLEWKQTKNKTHAHTHTHKKTPNSALIAKFPLCFVLWICHVSPKQQRKK